MVLCEHVSLYKMIVSILCTLVMIMSMYCVSLSSAPVAGQKRKAEAEASLSPDESSPASETKSESNEEEERKEKRRKHKFVLMFDHNTVSTALCVHVAEICSYNTRYPQIIPTYCMRYPQLPSIFPSLPLNPSLFGG